MRRYIHQSDRFSGGMLRKILFPAPYHFGALFSKARLIAGLLLAVGTLTAQKIPANLPVRGITLKTILLDSYYLHFPVKNGAPKQHLSLSVNGVKVREMEIELATGEPDFWVYTDVGEWMGKTMVVERDKAEKPAALPTVLFTDIFQSNAKDGADLDYKEKGRPQFHFTSRRGWLNDPNGLVFYKGEWNLFYQHNPFGTGWGNMTWGHAVSVDLIHWEEMDDAIQPDKLGTIFSGSAVVDGENTTGFKKGEESPLVAMYTAAGGTSNWSAGKPFGQCLAYSTDKGRHWIKYEKNPVLPNIKEGNRDPKLVWYEPTHQWVVALYLDGNTYALFSSPDLKNWKELQRISMEGSGECPDFFEIALDGDPAKKKWVLTGANDHYLVGSFDGKTFTPEQTPQTSDWGTNYYAVQSYSGVPVSDGRRIQIGWMSGAELPGMPFNQQMAFPRELSLRSTPDGIRLFCVPAREINGLHVGSHRWERVLLKGVGRGTDDPTLSPQGELFHVKAEFDLDSADRHEADRHGTGRAGTDPRGDVVEGLARDFGIRLRGFSVLYNTTTKMLCITRAHDTTVRYIPVPAFRGSLKCEILLDRTSLEVFVNDGIVAAAFAYLPDEEDKSIRLITHGGNVLLKSLDVYDLKSAWE